MELLRAHGFREVLALGGIEPGFTFRTDNLERRLDYIWITPDLAAREAVISPSTASDHLGVAATVEMVRTIEPLASVETSHQAA